MNDEFVPQWIVERKRDGAALAEADIREWIARYADGRLPDYQMAALAMAIYFRGMSPEETASPAPPPTSTPPAASATSSPSRSRRSSPRAASPSR